MKYMRHLAKPSACRFRLGGVGVSAILHSLLIVAVVVSAARVATVPSTKPVVVKVTFADKIKEKVDEATKPGMIKQASIIPDGIIKVLVPNIEVPNVSMPNIDLPASISGGGIDFGPLAVGVANRTRTSAETEAPRKEPINGWEADVRPEVLLDAQPQYPLRLRNAGVQGSLMVSFIIDTMGRADVSSVRLIEGRSMHESFLSEVIKALGKTKFVSAEHRGVKVPVLVTRSYTFNISR